MSAALLHYVGSLHEQGNPNQNYGSFETDAASADSAKMELSRQASEYMDRSGIASAILQVTQDSSVGITIQLENQKYAHRT